MKTIKAFLNNKFSIADMCQKTHCITITFDENEIVFVSCVNYEAYYGTNITYHRTVCLKGYGLIEILSEKKEDLFIERFDENEKED